jgi:hypothetical protein
MKKKCGWGKGAAQVRQSKGELGNPVLVAFALGKVGVVNPFLAVAANTQNLIVRWDASGHAIHNFAARRFMRHSKNIIGRRIAKMSN